MIPSDMATGDDDEIEEERRLLYVAMTRARDALHLYHPLRYYRRPRGLEDPHAYAQRSRFLTDEVVAHFDLIAPSDAAPEDARETELTGTAEVDAFLAGLWAD
jgi:DNA helicase-2/ATP-dependent DNA helicase PcrA